jgi:hypothetical protein
MRTGERGRGRGGASRMENRRMPHKCATGLRRLPAELAQWVASASGGPSARHKNVNRRVLTQKLTVAQLVKDFPQVRAV